jgi:hypothetical protein
MRAEVDSAFPASPFRLSSLRGTVCLGCQPQPVLPYGLPSASFLAPLESLGSHYKRNHTASGSATYGSSFSTTFFAPLSSRTHS